MVFTSFYFSLVSEIISAMTMADIQLRRATLEDEQGILDIMKEENLWEGMDSGLTW